MLHRNAKLFLIAAFSVLLWADYSIGADSEQYMKVKLCNSAETNCTQVSSSNAHVNLRNDSGDETGINNNGLFIQTVLSSATEVRNSRLFSTAVSVNAATAGSDNGLLYLRNPSGSGITMYVHRIVMATAIANVAVIGRIFSNPTISANGTDASEVNRRINSGSPAASVIATTLPTVTSTGTQLANIVQGQNSSPQIMVLDQSVAVTENNSLLITGDPQSNNRVVQITVIWSEWSQ